MLIVSVSYDLIEHWDNCYSVYAFICDLRLTNKIRVVFLRSIIMRE